MKQEQLSRLLEDVKSSRRMTLYDTVAIDASAVNNSYTFFRDGQGTAGASASIALGQKNYFDTNMEDDGVLQKGELFVVTEISKTWAIGIAPDAEMVNPGPQDPGSGGTTFAPLSLTNQFLLDQQISFEIDDVAYLELQLGGTNVLWRYPLNKLGSGVTFSNTGSGQATDVYHLTDYGQIALSDSIRFVINLRVENNANLQHGAIDPLLSINLDGIAFIPANWEAAGINDLGQLSIA